MSKPIMTYASYEYAANGTPLGRRIDVYVRGDIVELLALGGFVTGAIAAVLLSAFVF